jgi:hypothetical protein
MAKWRVDLKKPQSEVAKEDFPRPPGYNDDLETVRPLDILRMLLVIATTSVRFIC